MAFKADDRRLPLADGHGQAALRARQRLAAAGRLLHALRRGQAALLHVEPGRIVALDTEGLKDGKNDGSQAEKNKGANGRRRDLGIRHDRGAGRLPPQPRGQLAARGRRPVFVTTGNGVDEGHVNIPSPQRPELHRPRQEHGQARLGEQRCPARRSSTATGRTPPTAVRQGQAPGDLPRRRRLGLQPRAQDRAAPLEVQRQPQGLGVRPGRARHQERDHRHRGGLRRQGLRRRGPGPRARRGRRQLLGHRRHQDGRRHRQRAPVWHRGGNDFHRTISTVAIQDGIVYAADLSGFLYALDAKTGQLYWTHDMLAAVWGSPFVADGKIYLGDEDGDVRC